MATSKLLKPTNVTISIPEFTDQPDQRVNSNGLDKEADAINALSEQITQLEERPEDEILYQASAASHTFNFANSSRNVIIHTGDGVTRTYIAMIYSATNGTITVNEILKGTNVTGVDISQANKVTITMGSASAVYMRVINIRGDLPTNP